MAGFDLMIKGGTVATAADTLTSDGGTRDGRIAALAQTFGSDAAEGQ
jgi:dihydropyrimidinase